jgi:hypothetical protein
MQDRGVYTVEQPADTLDLTPGRIRQMLRAGDLGGSKEPGDRGWRNTGRYYQVLMYAGVRTFATLHKNPCA